MRVIFNDGVLRATLLDDNWVCVEWLTDTIGYLSKTVVKDLKGIEKLCVEKGYKGWILGSEVENTNMHKLIQRFGGVYLKDFEGYKIFKKEAILCAE